MEKITTVETPRKSGLIWKTLTFALWVALSFSNISCWNTTQKDVMEQQKKIENLSSQISDYINARKKLAEDYNKLLKYPKSKSNKNDINRSLAQIYEKISEYDEKLEDLAEDKLEAIDKLNEYIWNLEINYAPNEPIDPDRWDFLLTIQ